MRWLSSILSDVPTLLSFSIEEMKKRKFKLTCTNCAKDGHGFVNNGECLGYVDELHAFDVGCWRPVGCILVWDERVE